MRSSLEIYDIKSGTSHIVMQTDKLIEAPNWYPGDDALLVNGNGKLFRVPLDAAEMQPIETGFATACNNDHGFSPDGRRIVLSDRSRTARPCIYTVPIEGGEPLRITPQIASYWHGWSPDGSQIAYCAQRDSTFGIHVSDADGSNEIRLTDHAGHSDGPDYTRDGKWIWFNSSRDGSMELWRIQPDGERLEKMTDGSEELWFPHPNPVTDDVLFLAYQEGTREHPRDLDVSLWMMKDDGSGKTKLFDLFGGQGTINVPCWSSDGDRFAYVRFSPEV